MLTAVSLRTSLFATSIIDATKSTLIYALGQLQHFVAQVMAQRHDLSQQIVPQALEHPPKNSQNIQQRRCIIDLKYYANLKQKLREKRRICLQDLGLQWLMTRGKIATEEAYPYQGVDNFCSAKGRKHIKFSVRTIGIVSCITSCLLKVLVRTIGIVSCITSCLLKVLVRTIGTVLCITSCPLKFSVATVGMFSCITSCLLQFSVHTIGVFFCITSCLLKFLVHINGIDVFSCITSCLIKFLVCSIGMSSCITSCLLKFLVRTIGIGMSSCITRCLLSAAPASNAPLWVSVCCLMTQSWLYSHQQEII